MPLDLKASIGSILDAVKKTIEIPAEEKKCIRSSDVLALKQQEKQLLSILAIPSPADGCSPAKAELAESFSLWCRLVSLRKEYRAAEVILSHFCRSGRIRDYIGKIAAFAEEIDRMEDRSMAKEMGYQNYVFVLERFLAEMEQDYVACVHDEAYGLSTDPVCNVLRFLQEECEGFSSTRDLPKAYQALCDARELTVVGQPKTAQQVECISTLSGAIEMWHISSPKEKEKLQGLRAALNRRICNIEETIAAAAGIRTALIQCFSPQWCEAVDPRSATSIVCGLSWQEIQALYLEKVSEFKKSIKHINV